MENMTTLEEVKEALESQKDKFSSESEFKVFSEILHKCFTNYYKKLYKIANTEFSNNFVEYLAQENAYGYFLAEISYQSRLSYKEVEVIVNSTFHYFWKKQKALV